MSSQEILQQLKNSLDLEEIKSRKSEVIELIRKIENESLYNAILHDFLNIRYICGLTYEEAYQIPEVRRVFLDCIKNPSLKSTKKDDYGFDTVALLTERLNVEVLKNDSEFNEIIKNISYEQAERLLDGKEVLKLFDDYKYYEIFSKKAKFDNRFYKLFPYNKFCIEDDTFEEIIKQDSNLTGLSQHEDEIILEVLQKTTKTYNAKSLINNLQKYNEGLQKYIISIKEYALQLIYAQANIDYERSIIPPNLEADLIQQNLDAFDEMSYKQKYNFIYSLNDPIIQKYLIQKIKFMDNILSLPRFANIFLSIKDKDFMLECLLKKDIIEKMDNIDLRKILRELSPEYQRKLYENQVFQDYFKSISRFDAFQLLGYFEEEIIDSIIDNIKQVKINEICTIFQTSKNHKYLKDIIEVIKENELNPDENFEENIRYFYNNSIFVKDTLKELTDEEFEFFLERYKKVSNLKEAIDFVDRVITKTPISDDDKEKIKNIDFSKPITEEQKNILYQHRENLLYEKNLKEAIEHISKSDGRNINKFSYALFDSLTIEERKMILDHLTIECLIVLISVSNYVVDYCYDLYQKNPSIFDNIGEIPYIYISHNGQELSKDALDKLENMFKTLSTNAQESVINEALLEQDNIKNIIKSNLNNNPNAYSGKIVRKKFQPIFTKEEFKTLLEQLSLENFLSLISESTFYSEDTHLSTIEEVFKLRQDEILYKIANEKEQYNFKYNTNKIIKMILNNNQNKKSILDKFDIEQLVSFYDSLTTSVRKEDNDIIKVVFEQLVERQKELITIKERDLKQILSMHNQLELNKLIQEYDINEIIEIFAKTFNKDLESKIMYEFIKQPYFKNNTDFSIEELLSRLEQDNQNIITNCINEQFNNLEVPLNIKNKLRKVSYDEKLFLLYGIKRNILNEEKFILINELLDKDPFAINSLNIELFEDKIFELSKKIIPKIYRYENLTKDYLKLLKSKTKNSKLMLLLIEHLNMTTQNMDIYAKKLEAIINYLSNIEDFNLEKYNLNNITEEELKYLEEYICLNTSGHLISQEITFYGLRNKQDKLSGRTFKEISYNRILELDNKMSKDITIDDIKDCIFQKYFKLTKDQIELILRKYDTSLEKIQDKINNKQILNYYNEIKLLFNSTDVDELRRYYYENNNTHNLDECLFLYEELNRVYNESIASSIKGYKNGENKILEIKDGEEVKKTSIIELESDFELIVHSTDAYGQMEMINNNYFDSWNYSEKTSNHGICTSFISNSNMGTANVKGKGVMFGFIKLNSKSISSMAPYDLVSKNDEVITTTRRPPMYTDTKDLANYTRHTHNEIVLERRNVSEDSQYPVIQPDCLIIFEEMDEKIKQNTLKAQADFREKGIELPIIYISRKKVAELESKKVEAMLDIYDTNPNLELLAEIINKYESNRCGQDFDATFKPEELFDKERIYNTIIRTIEYVKNQPDQELIIKLINIIEHEQHKFDLIKETVGERAHKFDLLDKNLKTKLEELKALIIENKNDLNSGFEI